MYFIKYNYNYTYNYFDNYLNMSNLREAWYSNNTYRHVPLLIAFNTMKYKMVRDYLKHISLFIDNTENSAITGIYSIRVKPNERIRFDPHLPDGSITTIVSVDADVQYRIELMGTGVQEKDKEKGKEKEKETLEITNVILHSSVLLPYTNTPVYLIADEEKEIFICHFKNIGLNSVYTPFHTVACLEQHRSILGFNPRENRLFMMYLPFEEKDFNLILNNVFVYEKELEMMVQYMGMEETMRSITRS